MSEPDSEPSLPERKKAWRRIARALFALTPRAERASLDAALRDRLWEFVRQSLPGEAAEQKHVLAYAPMPDEADVMPFLRKWTESGGRLALPAWVGERGMELRAVADMSAQLQPGRQGILEPSPDCPEVEPEDIGLVIAPGRFFSERRDRLGRGAGCYDALLSRRDMKSIGVAYDFQIVPALPIAPDDVPVDAVLTPTRLIAKQPER